VFIRTNRFKENIKQQFEGKLISFPVATESTIEINSAIIAALHHIFIPGTKYKKAGVMLTEIVPNNKVQLSFFDELDRDKHNRLMKAIDSINTKSGHTSIGVASQSFDGFKMHREHLSPCYTTDWNDILIVK
jgi:DNA polymerase V